MSPQIYYNWRLWLHLSIPPCLDLLPSSVEISDPLSPSPRPSISSSVNPCLFCHSPFQTWTLPTGRRSERRDQNMSTGVLIHCVLVTSLPWFRKRGSLLMCRRFNSTNIIPKNVESRDFKLQYKFVTVQNHQTLIIEVLFFENFLKVYQRNY